jgi:Ca-activated chloride channel homolog
MQLTTFAPRRRVRAAARRGSVLVLNLFLISATLVIAALAVNVAYVELARTELRTATDAAAKAAAVVLGQTQDEGDARQAAIDVALLHEVAGRPVQLVDLDVQFGRTTEQSDGSFNFAEGTQPFNAVRVIAPRTNGSISGEVVVPLANIFNPNVASLTQTAVAVRIDHDVCVVVDRSGSMGWDLNNQPFKYPGTLATQSILQNYLTPPHATLSRWAAVRRSVEMFAELLEEKPTDVHVALASYASAWNFGTFISTVSTLNCALTEDYADFLHELEHLGEVPMIGDTNIAAGMEEGVDALTGGAGRQLTAQRTLIILTDGLKTQGQDPIEIAESAREQGVTTHCITYSAQANQDLMADVAEAGGGNYYHAPNEEALREAFRDIADSLPAVLVQ